MLWLSHTFRTDRTLRHTPPKVSPLLYLWAQTSGHVEWVGGIYLNRTPEITPGIANPKFQEKYDPLGVLRAPIINTGNIASVQITVALSF